MSVLMLIAGMTLLAYAGDALVHGAIEVAHRLHIPHIIIGLTVVAFGTSAPELIVSLQAALAGAPGLAIGNVVGSNVTNVLLVLGVPAIITPIILNDAGIRRSHAFMTATTLGLIWVIWDLQVTRLEGIALFTLLLAYLVYSAFAAKDERTKSLAAKATSDAPQTPDTTMSPLKTAGMVLFGMIGLGIGGKLTTEGALGIADMFGLANSTVGLTVVALGTSLPELAAGISAARRNQTGVIIGNVIGSNIFNVLGIIGITSMVVPLSISQTIVYFDAWIALATALLILPVVYFTRRINRWEGAVMTFAYLVFTVVVIRNGMAI